MKKRERRKRYDDGFAYPEKQVKEFFRKALPDFEVLWKGCFDDYNFVIITSQLNYRSFLPITGLCFFLP